MASTSTTGAALPPPAPPPPAHVGGEGAGDVEVGLGLAGEVVVDVDGIVRAVPCEAALYAGEVQLVTGDEAIESADLAAAEPVPAADVRVADDPGVLALEARPAVELVEEDTVGPSAEGADGEYGEAQDADDFLEGDGSVFQWRRYSFTTRVTERTEEVEVVGAVLGPAPVHADEVQEVSAVRSDEVGGGQEGLDPAAVRPVAAREAEGHADALDGVLPLDSTTHLPVEEVGHEVRV